MQYYEITFANGQTVAASNATDSHIMNCLENTDAVFNPTTEENANKNNCYYRLNDGIGWALMRMHALEAKIKKLEQKA
jgi:hypothetical protein